MHVYMIKSQSKSNIVVERWFLRVFICVCPLDKVWSKSFSNCTSLLKAQNESPKSSTRRMKRGKSHVIYE